MASLENSAEDKLTKELIPTKGPKRMATDTRGRIRASKKTQLFLGSYFTGIAILFAIAVTESNNNWAAWVLGIIGIMGTSFILVTWFFFVETPPLTPAGGLDERNRQISEKAALMTFLITMSTLGIVLFVIMVVRASNIAFFTQIMPVLLTLCSIIILNVILDFIFIKIYRKRLS